MKIIIGYLLLLVLPLRAMDKIAHIFGTGHQSKEEKDKPKTPREEKQKQVADSLKDDAHKRPSQRRGSEIPPARETQSASPLKGSSSSPARPKANTIGKRGSLDWSGLAIQETVKQIHIDESLKRWAERDAAEENLKKLFEEFSTADPKRQQEIYCIIMRAPGVSGTKEAMASNFFEMSYKVASTALYNIPGYFSTNVEGAYPEIKTFYNALYDAKEAYVNKLMAQAPKRNKWSCEQVALTDPGSPIFKLLAQIKALKNKYPQYEEDLGPEIFPLSVSRIQDPKKP